MNSKSKGLIFDIQRYAIHDGPGIRTTAFLKGCPNRCKWCANPESQKSVPQITYLENECLHCGSCAKICSKKAIAVSKNSHFLDRGSCDLCGQCAAICPGEALQIVGRYVSPKELFDEMAADQPFWERSGGGITLSGGEPLAQPEFVLPFIKFCKENYVHTVIETSLHVPPKIIKDVLLQVDDIICDIKIMDENRHKAFIGVSNKLILDNLALLLKSSKSVLVRIPLIPSINDDRDNIEATGVFLSSNRQKIQIELLPYHRLGESKYARLGRSYGLGDIVPPTDEDLENAKKELKKFNITMAKT
jgi:pyruvate formate lyase activating enzyme